MDHSGFLLKLLQFITDVKPFRALFAICFMLKNAALLDFLMAIPAFKQPDACVFTKQLLRNPTRLNLWACFSVPILHLW